MQVNIYRQAFKAAIARVYHTNGAIVGAGFLVSETQLLTCAHVVTAALGIPADTATAPTALVEVDFPLIAPGQKVSAEVVFWSPVNPTQTGEDIAGLVLKSAAPSGCQPVRLVTADEYWNHAFQIFGFPSKWDNGVWASGVLRDRLANGWVQMEDIKAQGYAVQPGFSGAPVWDEQLQAVVGMAVAAEKKREEAKAAFMIPVAELGKARSALAQWRSNPAESDVSAAVNLPSFRQVQLKAKKDYYEIQLQKYKAAYNQLSFTLNQADAVAVNVQIKTLETELQVLEQEIRNLEGVQE
jgi:hypothetical protein